VPDDRRGELMARKRDHTPSYPSNREALPIS
jgi:hypothetical protein